MAGRRTTARDLAQIAVFAALIAALGLPGTLYLGSTAVPITLQTLGVMLAGALLGARKGALAVIVFQVLALAGLPIYAGFRTGVVAYSSAAFGYSVGWIFGAFVIGLLTARLLPKYPFVPALLATAFGGIVVIYFFGTVGVMIRSGLPLGAALAGNTAFLIGDGLKVLVTVVVAGQVHRAYPGLLTPSRRRSSVGSAS